MVYVCRKEHFNAAHRLYNPAWSDEKNMEIFGACSNKYFHGHNFELIVKVKGTPHPDTACVIDLKLLSRIIKEHITEKVDHKNLNIEVDFLKDKMPSCEIIVMEFWKILEKEIAKVSDAQLHSLTLYETHNNFVEYFGE